MEVKSKYYVRQYPAFIVSIADTIVPIFRKLFRKEDNGIIGLVSLHLLGDTVMTIPAIQALQGIYPHKKIVIFCFEESRIIYELKLKGFSYEVIQRNDYYFSNRIPSLRAIRKFIKINASTIIDLTGSINSSFLILFAKANKIYGLKNYSSFRLLEKIYHYLTEIRQKPHLVDMYLDVIRLISDSFVDAKILYSLEYPREKNNIVIHPFASRKVKEFPLNQFIEIAKHLGINQKVKFILPKNRADEEVLKLLKKDNIDFVVTSDVAELINELRITSLFIGNDSGPMHLAAMLGKPTFTIFGPVNPQYSKPTGDHNEFYFSTIDCVPKETHYCETLAGLYCPHINCMVKNNTEEVLNAIETFIKKVNDQVF